MEERNPDCSKSLILSLERAYCRSRNTPPIRYRRPVAPEFKFLRKRYHKIYKSPSHLLRPKNHQTGPTSIHARSTIARSDGFILHDYKAPEKQRPDGAAGAFGTGDTAGRYSTGTVVALSLSVQDRIPTAVRPALFPYPIH